MGVNLLSITKEFNTQKKCLDYLKLLRWGKKPVCPSCSSKKIRQVKTSNNKFVCRSCKEQFSVFSGTIFEGTRLPLTKWFASIALVLNAKSGVAAKNIQRNIGLTYKTAYYTAMRTRIGMLSPETKLNGILEMDESYFGGKARLRKKFDDSDPSLARVTTKRGRGTNKVAVAGIVERRGNIKTQVMERLTKKSLMSMLKRNAKNDGSILITDGFKSYNSMDSYIDRLVINHSKEYSKGMVHINTIEGYWSFVKNGIKGSYRAISKKYLPFYLIEFEWKYNNRNYKGNEFELYLKNALTQDKELEYWKAKSTKQVKEIAYSND